MTTINGKVNDFEVVVRAGPGGESDDNIFRYVMSRIPSWAKSVDDPLYRAGSTAALNAARDLVKQTNRPVTLTYSVRF